MEYKDMNKGVDDLVMRSEGPDTINDAFCFVVGFTQAEIKSRMALLFDNRTMTKAEQKTFDMLQGKLDQLNAAWKAFIDADPTRPNLEAAAEGRIGHTVAKHPAPKARKGKS